jgi:hypothetical protein
MHVFLEAAACLGRADGREVFYRRLEKLGDIEFDLFAQAGILKRFPQFGLFDMGESATQRTFHNVIVDHGQPLIGDVWNASIAPFSGNPLEDGNFVFGSDRGRGRE